MPSLSLMYPVLEAPQEELVACIKLTLTTTVQQTTKHLDTFVSISESDSKKQVESRTGHQSIMKPIPPSSSGCGCSVARRGMRLIELILGHGPSLVNLNSPVHEIDFEINEMEN